MSFGVVVKPLGSSGKIMKVLHITTIDVGGAYKAAVRLHEGLQLQGVETNILLRTKVNKNGVGEEVFSNKLSAGISKAKNVWNMLHANGEISRDIYGTNVVNHPLVQEADIIVVHWINSFLSIKELGKLFSLRKPIVCFLHDMWLMTGGCHYDMYCGQYEKNCSSCPLMHKQGKFNTAFLNFQEKKVLLEDKNNVVIAGPSQWIVDCASKSQILTGKQFFCLPNMLDINIYAPIETKKELREKYKINSNKKVILFGAADTGTENKMKGFKYLLEALELLPREQYQLAVFGNAGNNVKLPQGFEVTLFGYVKDESVLREIYNIADVLVNPSEQEAFGYTACEAMACGTPVVAFPIGGLQEQITHKQNGYLAEYHNSNDLAEGIRYCTENREQLSIEAVRSAQKYSYQNMVQKYIEVFKKII